MNKIDREIPVKRRFTIFFFATAMALSWCFLEVSPVEAAGAKSQGFSNAGKAGNQRKRRAKETCKAKGAGPRTAGYTECMRMQGIDV